MKKLSVRSLVQVTLCAAAVLCGSSLFAATVPGAILWMVNSTDETVDYTYINGPHGTDTVKTFVSWDGKSTINAARMVAYKDGTKYVLNSGYDESAVSPIVKVDGDSNIESIWAYLGSLQGSADAYTYALELGSFNDGIFDVLAKSEAVAFTDLQSYYQESALDFPVVDPWITATVVPEPTGALLFLIGGALLALRRKEV